MRIFQRSLALIGGIALSAAIFAPLKAQKNSNTGTVALNARLTEQLSVIVNKANIAVYPVDVRGLAASSQPRYEYFQSLDPGRRPGFPPSSELRSPESPFAHLPGLLAALAAPRA